MMLLLSAAVIAVCYHASAENPAPGEESFNKNCAVCHPDGGNIINDKKTIRSKDLKAKGINNVADIVRIMRNPGPGMSKYDADEIPDKEARDIAAYILKKFK